MVVELLTKIAQLTEEQIESAARALSSIFGRLNHGLLVRAEEPLPVLDLDQLYTAIRILDPEADVPISLEETIAPGYSGTIIYPLPAGIYCIQRYGIEWGDPVVKVKWSIDSPERVAVPLHTMPPSPIRFEFARYWTKREVLYIYRENTDNTNSAEYHFVVDCVLVKRADWEKWGPRIRRYAEALLEAPPPPPPPALPE